MNIHYARTPTRIDLAGGWTDVPLFAEVVPGAVLNVAINLYSHVRIVDAPRASDPLSARRVPDDPISMYSVDYDEAEDFSSARQIQGQELSGSFGLVKAALRRRQVDRGLRIVTRCDAPPGSGLGTSASMGVALLGALNSVMGVRETAEQTAETAVALETEEMGILSGKQDHYAAALGGVQYMTFRGPAVESTPLNLGVELIADLQRRIVIAYTERSRLSGDVHRHVVARFESHNVGIMRLLAELAHVADSARDTLLRGSFDELAELVNMNWELQKALHPAINTDELTAFESVGVRHGAVGVKACGAGGGGCLLCVCEDGAEGRVARALAESGATVLRFDVPMTGLLTWRREAADHVPSD